MAPSFEADREGGGQFNGCESPSYRIPARCSIACVSTGYTGPATVRDTVYVASRKGRHMFYNAISGRTSARQQQLMIA